MRFLVVLGSLIAAFQLACTTPVPAQAFDSLTGGPGRVIVIDASGSMARQDYDANPKERMKRASGLFREYVSRLAAGDPLPTAVHVFGSQLRWSDVAAVYGNDSQRYPASGELCRDIQQIRGFSRIDAATASDAVDRIEPRGMTPIHVALSRALDALDPVHGGEIVLISDMDAQNCLPPGMTVCQALQPALSRFREVTSKVSVKVFELPSAKISEELKPCLSVQNFPYPITKKDPKEPVDDAMRQTGVNLVARYRTQPEIAAQALDPTQIAVRLRAGGGSWKSVYEGVPGQIRVAPGGYELDYTVGRAAQASLALRVVGMDTLHLDVDPAIIRFELLEMGAPVSGSASLTITDSAGGQVVASGLPVRHGQSLRFGTGEYELRGELADGRSAIARIATPLASSSVATLDFGAARTVQPAVPTGRTVQFQFLLHNPTLADAMRQVGLRADFAPRVELEGYGPLPLGGIEQTLAAGTYRVRVGTSAPLEFTVSAARPGAPPVQVRVELMPGWFSAHRSQPGTLRLLLAAGGTTIGEFDASDVAHSLPDGDYVLELLSAERQTIDSQRFTISPGTMSEIRF
jgi:hypothetical protein